MLNAAVAAFCLLRPMATCRWPVSPAVTITTGLPASLMGKSGFKQRNPRCPASTLAAGSSRTEILPWACQNGPGGAAPPPLGRLFCLSRSAAPGATAVCGTWSGTGSLAAPAAVPAPTGGQHVILWSAPGTRVREATGRDDARAVTIGVGVDLKGLMNTGWGGQVVVEPSTITGEDGVVRCYRWLRSPATIVPRSPQRLMAAILEATRELARDL